MKNVTTTQSGIGICSRRDCFVQPNDLTGLIEICNVESVQKHFGRVGWAIENFRRQACFDFSSAELFDPPPFDYLKLFGSPFQTTQNFFGPLHFAQPPTRATKVFLNTPP